MCPRACAPCVDPRACAPCVHPVRVPPFVDPRAYAPYVYRRAWTPVRAPSRAPPCVYRRAWTRVRPVSVPPCVYPCTCAPSRVCPRACAPVRAPPRVCPRACAPVRVPPCVDPRACTDGSSCSVSSESGTVPTSGLESVGPGHRSGLSFLCFSSCRLRNLAQRLSSGFRVCVREEGDLCASLQGRVNSRWVCTRRAW